MCKNGTPAVTGQKGFLVLLCAGGQGLASEAEACRVNGLPAEYHQGFKPELCDSGGHQEGGGVK